MKSVILVKARPGFDVISSEALKRLVEEAEGVKITDVIYCFGRFDGVIILTADELDAIAKFAEYVRREGNFLTETLIAVE